MMISGKDVVGDKARILAQEHEIAVSRFGKLQSAIKHERTMQPCACDQQTRFRNMERAGTGRVPPLGGWVISQPKVIGEALGRTPDGVTGARKHRSA